MHNVIDLYTVDINTGPPTSWNLRTSDAQLGTVNTVKSMRSNFITKRIKSIASCCGATADLANSRSKYSISSNYGEPYSPRCLVENKGVLVIPEHTDRVISGATKKRYSLGDYKFDVFLQDQNLDEWLPEAEQVAYDAQTKEMLTYGVASRDGTDYELDYTRPIIAVYAGCYTLDPYHKVTLELLERGYPIIAVGALTGSDARLHRFISEQNLKKYVVDIVPNVFNMNYHQRRLTFYLLYKG